MPKSKPKTKAGKKNKSQQLVSEAMSEVHRNEPSTVTRAKVQGKQKEKMLQAIAFSKARDAGAHVPAKSKKSARKKQTP